MGCSSAAGDQDKALTLTKTALLRVNYEVSSLKLFAHLAFPHSPTLENTPKQPSFHGRMDGRFSLVLCADTTGQCRMSEKPTTSPGIVSELATNREWSF
jgi:hypothetical protein